MKPRLRTESAVILRTVATGTADGYGNKIERDVRTATKVAVFTDDSGEQIDQADQQTESYKLALDVGLGLDGTERIELRGEVFHFRGRPQEITNQRTRQLLYARAYVWRSIG